MSWNVEFDRAQSRRFEQRSSDVTVRALPKKICRGLLLSLIASALAGCQQLGIRPAGFYADEDDWGAPPSNVSQVPRPYIETKRSKQNVSDSAVKTGLSDQNSTSSASTEKTPPPSDSKSIAVTATGNSPAQNSPSQNSAAATAANAATSATPSSSDPALQRTPSMVVDTGLDNVDLDAAMEGLPIQYQEILKRQLTASKKQTVAAATPAAESDANSESVHDSTSGKVSFRLSDQAQESAVAASAGKDESTVITASANLPKTEVASAPHTTAALPTTATLPTTAAPPAATAEAKGASSTGPNETIANAGTNAGTNVGWNQSVAQAILALEKQMEASPASDENLRLHQELTLRMLYASIRRPEEAMQPISGLSDEENEYYRNQMMALIEASNPDAMPVRSRHLSLVMDSQRKATGFLAAASNLEVRNMAFCTDVERYGVVTKFPRYQFKPDEEVLLYCEVENVSALPVKDGFESQLQGSYEILDAGGNRIIEQTLPMEPDICQNVRRDYYMVYRIFMPQQISPGNYKLRLTIEDLKARKYGQSTLDLQIKK